MSTKSVSQNYLLGWMSVGVILTTVVVILAAWSIAPTRPAVKNTAGISIRTLSNQAFGSLQSQQKTSLESAAPMVDSAGRSTGQVTIAPAPEPEEMRQYVYEYAGDIPAVDLPVLRRQIGLGGDAVTGWLGGRLTNLIDAGKFQSLEPLQLTLAEPGTDGYSLSLDYQSGTISLYRNLGTGILKAEATSRGVPANPTGTLPVDAGMLRIANAFLDTHAMSRAGLGDPIVRNDWMRGYTAASQADRPSFLPAEVTVVYPWIMQSRNVYDESGRRYGLFVTISAQDKSVTSVSNLVPMKFDASGYALTRDSEMIRQLVRRGGLYGSLPAAEATSVVTVQVGKPEVAYVVSRYQLDQKNVDYLVPALVFPIENTPANQPFLPQNITIPLVQQLIDAATVVPVPGGIEPLTSVTPDQTAPSPGDAAKPTEIQ